MRLLAALFLLVLVHPAHAANLASGGPPSSTGELRHSLQLPLPPGSGGVEPALSLEYGHRDRIEAAARRVYADFPEILSALGL